MEEKYNLEVKGICQFEIKMNLTYRSIEGPTACKIKEVTWENVNISEYKGYCVKPIVKWYDGFTVINIGKELVFDDHEQCLIKEDLGLNGDMLAYCDEESLAIIVSNKLMGNQTLVESLRMFFTPDKWVGYDCKNVNVSTSPFPF